MPYGENDWGEEIVPKEEMVPRSELIAVLRMLLKRATLADRYHAWQAPNSWMHKAEREIRLWEATHPPQWPRV